jgi:hypothetical protein
LGTWSYHVPLEQQDLTNGNTLHKWLPDRSLLSTCLN